MNWSAACGDEVVEQIIRPTGLVDPVLHVSQRVPDLIVEIKKRRVEHKERTHNLCAANGWRRLTPITSARPVRTKWLHSELDAIERMPSAAPGYGKAADVLVSVFCVKVGSTGGLLPSPFSTRR